MEAEDRLHVLLHGDISAVKELIKDTPLPYLEPIDDCPVLPPWKPEPDPDVEHVERICQSGEVNRAAPAVEQLLQSGKHVSSLRRCLIQAIESGHLDIVRLLLCAGVEIKADVIEPALRQVSLPVLTMLFQHGWDINEQEAWYIPPWLSMAVHINPDHALMAWFLKYGADPDQPCQMGTTPLSTAAGRAPLSIVQHLLRSCRDPTRLRGSLVHFAAQRDDEEAVAVLRTLLDTCKPDINAVKFHDNSLGYHCYVAGGLGTALHEAARSGRREAAELLVQHGADVSLRDSCGHTAREVAEADGNLPVLEFLKQVEEEQLPRSPTV